MKNLKFIFVNLLIVTSLLNCSKEKDDIISDVLDPTKPYQELDISYGKDSKQTFDLYLPANRSSNTKLMILVHGGGWSGGDKVEMSPFKDIFLKDFPKLAIANINYKLATEDLKPYPMQINDITTIVNYLNQNKTKYTISNSIGFLGVSAGAHLSLLWSYAFDSNKNVDMVCGIVGPTNFTDPAYLNNTNPELQNLLNLYGVNPVTSFLEEASPYHQVTKNSPPTILFYGGKDPLIPTTQGTDLRDKLKEFNVKHEFTLYPNAGHGWQGLELLDTWAKLKTFTNANLQP